jgi:hypothetical protein
MSKPKFHCVEPGTKVRLCGVSPEHSSGFYPPEFNLYALRYDQSKLCAKCVAKFTHREVA